MKAGKILAGVLVAIGVVAFLSVIIDKESGSGVVPYLPLPELKKGSNN